LKHEPKADSGLKTIFHNFRDKAARVGMPLFATKTTKCAKALIIFQWEI
jgi:hypothetical protein